MPHFAKISRISLTEESLSLGKAELERLAEEQQETEVCCHFCNKKYRFSAEELKCLAENC